MEGWGGKTDASGEEGNWAWQVLGKKDFVYSPSEPDELGTTCVCLLQGFNLGENTI